MIVEVRYWEWLPCRFGAPPNTRLYADVTRHTRFPSNPAYPQSGGNSCILVDDNLYRVWYSQSGTFPPGCLCPSSLHTALWATCVGLGKGKGQAGTEGGRGIITYLLVYSMERSPSYEANRFSASQEIPPFYGTQRFITAFTSARHLSLSWARSIQSMTPHPTSWKSI
jgi:hypothetical protein